jgi:hypothetical protein
MSVEKVVVRSHVLNELGAKADDFLEKYRAELLKYEGAVTGVSQAQQAVESVLALIDKEIDERRMDLTLGRTVKDWVLKSSQAVAHVKTTATQLLYTSKGKIEAAQQQVAFIKQVYDIEKAKLVQYTQEQESDNVIPIGGDGRARPISIKTRRLREGDPQPKKRRDGKKQGPGTKATNKQPSSPEQPKNIEKTHNPEEPASPSKSS